MSIIIWLAASILSGIAGRLGGMGEDGWKKHQWLPKWIFDTKVRDLGCPLICYGYLLTMWQPCNALGWGMLFIAFGLMFPALTTYWDSVFGEDNFFAHGLGCGLATFPLYWAGIHWYSILCYALVTCLSMGLYSNWVDDDDLEEFGRYFLLCFFIPLLII